MANPVLKFDGVILGGPLEMTHISSKAVSQVTPMPWSQRVTSSPAARSS